MLSSDRARADYTGQLQRAMKRRLVAAAGALIVGYLGVGFVFDRFVFPEPDPDESYYPQVGRVFISRTEGFEQRILKYDAGLVWSEVTLRPYAPGPPVHVHTSFGERFLVAQGTISLLVNGETKLLHAGEEWTVPPGTPHKPFNPTDTTAVVRGPFTPEYALPRQFAVFLTQAYGFFDESEANGRPPRALLQMSRFSPRYDSWLASPPITLQQALYFVIGPTARLLGYRSYYPRFATAVGGRGATIRRCVNSIGGEYPSGLL